MTLYDYIGSQKVAAQISGLTMGNEFYTLIMAAIRYADTDNIEKLKDAYPELYEEFRQRYVSPGGALTNEEYDWVVKHYHEGKQP